MKNNHEAKEAIIKERFEFYKSLAETAQKRYESGVIASLEYAVSVPLYGLTEKQ